MISPGKASLISPITSYKAYSSPHCGLFRPKEHVSASLLIHQWRKQLKFVSNFVTLFGTVTKQKLTQSKRSDRHSARRAAPCHKIGSGQVRRRWRRRRPRIDGGEKCNGAETDARSSGLKTAPICRQLESRAAIV
jgi:hypothetical protein